MKLEKIDLIKIKCTDKTFPKSRFTQNLNFDKMEMFTVYIQNVSKC